MSDSHGLQPTRLLWPWDFPGKNTGLGCHCLLRQNCYSHTLNQECGWHRTNRYYPFFTFPTKASLWSKHICLLKEQAYNSNLVPVIIRRHCLIQDRDSQSSKNHLFLGRLCPQVCSNDTTCFPLSSRVRHQKSEALLESNRSSYHQLPSQVFKYLVFKEKMSPSLLGEKVILSFLIIRIRVMQKRKFIKYYQELIRWEIS